eukprot:6182793-Pleurochrysis_carterae.AAC.2
MSFVRSVVARGTLLRSRYDSFAGRLRQHEVMRQARFLCRGMHAMVVNDAGTAAERGGEKTARIVEVESLAELPRQDPQANVQVDVHHSTLNYKVVAELCQTSEQRMGASVTLSHGRVDAAFS